MRDFFAAASWFGSGRLVRPASPEIAPERPALEGAVPSGAGLAYGPAPAPRYRWRRLWPLFFLAAGLIAFFALGLDHYLNFAMLRENRAALLLAVNEHPLAMAALFLLLYVITTALSLPVASLGDPLRARALRRLKPGLAARIERGFQANALSYMLALRLAPIVPFFVVNILPAFLGVRLRPYLLGTLIGIVPGTFVYTLFGVGLDEVFARGDAFSLDRVLSPALLGALFGMAALAMLPVLFKWWRGRRDHA
jgi:uncharacterized membrane protein YdjX (TVP38/TMEM64 family)